LRILREPLLHFAVAGAILFAAYECLNPSGTTSRAMEAVKIGEGEVRWLQETFANQWRRSPTAEEMKALVATLVEEELLASEARTLGLDQHDTVVRRRLAQKLTFIVEDTLRIADPSEDELRRFYSVHGAAYRTEPRVSFSHIFFSPQRRSEALAEATAALLRASASGDVESDPIPLDANYVDVEEAVVTSLFGAEFTRAIYASPLGSWNGPVRSAYGLHLVHVTQLRSGDARRFEDVRDAVMNDWRREQERNTKAAYLAKLRDKHGIAFDSGAKELLRTDLTTQ
jgi:parvulin-like peptidyl-prolyl isomerase